MPQKCQNSLILFIKTRKLEKICCFINKSKFAIFNRDFVKEIYEKRI